eukprot:459316_1
MDDSRQNAIRIKEWRDLHLKYALGWYIKFKTHYICESHKYKWKQLQWNFKWKLMIKIIILSFFRPAEYEPDYSQTFGTTKYFAVYAVKLYSITVAVLVLLQ